MKEYKIYLITTAILFWVVNLTSRAPDTLWTKTYGGEGSDRAYSVEQTTDGGFIIAGYINSFGAGNFDVYLIKTDGEGDTHWTKTYGGIEDDKGFAVQQINDGGYIVTGCTRSFGTVSSDVYLIKVDSLGDTLWTRTYGYSGMYDDFGRSVQQTTDGGFIIAGYTSFGAGNYDVYLIKTDSMGDTLWTKIYGEVYSEYAYSVEQTTDSGFIIAGTTESYGAGQFDVWIIKTDMNGDTLWTRTYGGELSDFGWSIIQTNDGGYAIAGFTNSFRNGGYDVYAIKTNSIGDTLWTRTYGGIWSDNGYSIQQTYGGGYIITGGTCSYGIHNRNVYLIKTESNGNILWQKTFGDSTTTECRSVKETYDGGYIITGKRYTLGSGYDVYLIRTDAQGESLWTKTYGGDTTDIGYSVYETSDGGYIIAGETVSFGAGRSDFYLIKTEPDPSFVQEQKYHSLEKNKKELAYHPNPFTSVVNIKCFGIDDKRKVRLGIYDSSGRLIKTILLSTDHLSLGSDLPPGIYFLKLNGKLAGKVVKVR